MPVRNRLSAKEIHRDWRRLRSISGVAGGGVAPHTLLGIVHSDTTVYAPTQGAFIVANDTPAWTGLAHPGSANRYIIANAADPGWTADIPLDDDAYVGITGGGRFVFDSTPAPDQIDVTSADLYFATTGHGIIHVDGVAAGQYLRADGTRYIPGTIQVGDVPGLDAQFVTMAVSADLANERVLTGGDSITLTDGGAGGNATLDLDTPGTLTVATANNATAPHLHAITSSSNPGAAASILATDAAGALSITGDFSVGQYIVHIGDADTYLDFQDDRVALWAGGVRIWDAIEGASDLLWVDVTLDMNGNDIILGADNDTYIHETAVDDVVELVLATAAGEFQININGADDFRFIANSFEVQAGSVVDMNGQNLVIDADGDTYAAEVADDEIGLYIAGNLQYAFDTTELTLSTAAGADVLFLRTHGDVAATGADMYASAAMGLAADEGIYLFIDADNNATNTGVYVLKDAETSGAATEIFRIQENARVGINYNAPLAMLHIDQSSTTAAIQVLYLDQADVDVAFVKFVGEASAGVLGRNIVDEGDQSSETRAAWIKVFVQDDGNQIADQNYFIPLYTLS